MKIVADEAVADAVRLFSDYGEVSLYPGREINADLVADADVLLVRSITPVNSSLLARSRVSFVGSATIGTDHVDNAYLSSRDIRFAHAPGCNANAVVQYVIAVLCSSIPGWRHKTLAIIGCGHVGGRLLKCLQGLGVSCKVYDPFLDAAQCQVLVDLPEAMAADIVCVHTPLTHDGPFPTYHIIDGEALDSMASGAVLINAGRGAVVDNQALLDRLEAGQDLRVVLDVWEHEPDLSLALLNSVLLGTPHIAGYSVEGKLRGTQMLLEAFCRWLNEAAPVFTDKLKTHPISNQDLSGASGERSSTLENIVLTAYNPGHDFQTMNVTLNNCETDLGQCFDSLRRNYRQRREFSHYELDGINNTALRRDLDVLGFSVR